MRGTVIHAPRDIRLEDLPDPTITAPRDAIVRTVATCVCGSDLWRYRGIADVPTPTPIGHEYVGVVEEVGGDVTTVRPGQFVVGGFLTSDNTWPPAGTRPSARASSPGAPSWCPATASATTSAAAGSTCGPVSC
jgi:threonine dehydrogenase-like Zn-dependent dehydrogenase